MVAFTPLQLLKVRLRLRVVVAGVFRGSFGYYVFPAYVELAKFPQVIDQKMVQFDGLLRLVKSVLVSMYLGKDRTELHLQP